MALFEGYERRIKQINEALNKYGIADIEEARKITEDAGRCLQHGKGRSDHLLRECLLGLHRRCCNRNQEELQKRS